MSNFLFLGTEEDKPFLPRLKPCMKGKTTFVDLNPVSTVAEVEIYCKNPKRNITGVLSTSQALLSKFTDKKNPSLDSYAGSYFKRNGIEYVFINPLEHSVTVPYGTFLLERFASKLVAPEKWLKAPDFRWRILNPANVSEAITFLSHSKIIACDIETFKENLAIRCIGFTGVTDSMESFSYVLVMDTEWALGIAEKILSLPAPKIFQNGKYDINYLLRYNLIPYNYMWDTAALFHCLYCELPKDLGFLQAFFVREAAYWKDLADTNDLEQYYLYNAKDTWATACVLLAWIAEAPPYAWKNYQLEFPLQFPCILSEMTGLALDESRRDAASKELDTILSSRQALLEKTIGVPGFNVNSPVQMKALMKVLGCGDLQGADAKALAKAAYRHPLNGHIIELITGTPKTDDPNQMGIRSIRKVQSTYLIKGKDLNGRLLYALNPHGTDSGRLASKDHHFWCGYQIQNIPGGKTVKQTLRADPGFYIAESDLEQAETRDTAHITGDEALLRAISSGRDFHSVNTAAFFGVPYESVYDDAKGKTINKPLRDIAKRVNHGANYNMGPAVLVDTMGLKKIYEAAKLLGLPKHWEAKDIATHLLEQFDKTYPTIRGDYQTWVISQILTHKKLVGATGWTRYCFGNPKTSKPVLNSYVAHSPQSLNAMVLNIAYMKVFYDIAIHPDHRYNFKLCAQIHDSILFQYRIGHDYLCEMVKERMQVPVQVTDIAGVTRTLIVPAALKANNATYWSETE